jgi:hypothetical protein
MYDYMRQPWLLDPALPGEYTVKLALNGRTWEQPLTVRLDPRVSATSDDLRVYYEVRKMEGIECSVATAANRIEVLDRQLSRIDAEGAAANVKSEAAASRAALKRLAADFIGDPRDPTA